MAMQNVGRIDEIWHWPYHKFMAIRSEYLKIVNPVTEETIKGNIVEIAPGITVEHIQREQ